LSYVRLMLQQGRRYLNLLKDTTDGNVLSRYWYIFKHQMQLRK